MGRGGRSGGSRSSGGRSRSSSRSSGGRRSSSHSSGRSSFSSSSSRSHHSYSGSYGRRTIHHSHYYGGSGGVSSRILRGCLLAYICFFFFGTFIMHGLTAVLFYQFNDVSPYSVSKSTIEREALPKGSVNETGYYTDELDWIYDKHTLLEGMKEFYSQTGVQPYLYITDTVNGTKYPSDDDLDIFVQEKYDELFTDEAHFLLVFHENESNPGEYSMWYVMGDQARSVMDEEACDILLDYLDRYYYSDLSEEEYFSQAFHDAGKRIMHVTVSPWIYVIIALIVLLIIFLLFTWWKKAKRQKNLEAEQTERILSTPLETFGDANIDELTKKYDQ